MQQIDRIRNKIALLDASIIKKLAKRQALSREIAMLKLAHGLAIFDAAREQTLYQHYDNLCKKYNIQPDYIRCLFTIILENSRAIQAIVTDSNED